MDETIEDFLEAIEVDGLHYAVVHYSDWTSLSRDYPHLYHFIYNMQVADRELEKIVTQLEEDRG